MPGEPFGPPGIVYISGGGIRIILQFVKLIILCYGYAADISAGGYVFAMGNMY